MKRIIAVLLVAASIFLVSCGGIPSARGIVKKNRFRNDGDQSLLRLGKRERHGWLQYPPD